MSNESDLSVIVKGLESKIDLLSAKIDGFGDKIVTGFAASAASIVTSVDVMRKEMMPAATSENKISSKVIMPIIHTLCGTITALVVWFTGIYPWIPNAHNQNVHPQARSVQQINVGQQSDRKSDNEQTP